MSSHKSSFALTIQSITLIYNLEQDKKKSWNRFSDKLANIVKQKTWKFAKNFIYYRLKYKKAKYRLSKLNNWHYSTGKIDFLYMCLAS